MDTQLLLSLIAGIFISGAAGYLGSLMISKRMALVAGPLGHLTLPGVALALVYDFNMSLGAAPFVFLGIFFIWMLELKTKLPMETLTAVVFASGVAIGFLFLPIDKAEAALMGDITKISFLETVISVLIVIVLSIIIRFIYPKMVIINISEDLAQAEGINVKKYNFIYLFLIAVIVSLGVKIVGGLLTAALVAIPAAAARNLSQNLSQYVFASTCIGITSSLGGILICNFTGFPSGAVIILVSMVIFLVSIAFKK